eukprot:15159681-Alexandrium_andersonii.AAC.1
MVAVLLATWVMGFVKFGRDRDKGDTDPPAVGNEPDEEPDERRADARNEPERVDPEPERRQHEQQRPEPPGRDRGREREVIVRAPDQIWFTAGGEKYHVDKDCFGLRKRTHQLVCRKICQCCRFGVYEEREAFGFGDQRG